MLKTCFVTGTDTGVGKTLVTCGLIKASQAAGLSAVGLKPVAAGCELEGQNWVNEDARALQKVSSIAMPYSQVNPVALEAALAPHIAAARCGRRISAERLEGFCRGAMMQKTDRVFIEGAGGWRVPLNPRETLADLARRLQTPVVLVVGMRLGCLNHALLTAEAIAADGLPLAGWVANCIDPAMAALEENVQTLATLLPAPCLGVLPHLPHPSAALAAEHLTLPSF